MNNPTYISVVVCTYNRAGLLDRALRSLLVQRCPAGLEYEVIVVDDGSTDSTPEVVREAGRCTDRRVTYVRESGRGISAARNAGVEAAQGEWIAFTDDDQVVAPTWLANLWQAQVSTGAMCIGGARTLELPEDVLRTLPSQIRLILGEIQPLGDVRVGDRNALLCTGNLLIRRDLVLDLGGFDVSLTQGGEDTDLLVRLRRAGHRCWFTPHALVQHIIPPYRLEKQYLVWAARRGGDCYAVRDVRECGIVRSWFIATLRLTQAITILLPAWACARAVRNAALATAYECRALRAIAYARRVVQLAFAKKRGKAVAPPNAIEFRGERQMFDQAV